jgi:peptidoglycan hydrolase-like protein with peptidoglycan-binding domain
MRFHYAVFFLTTLAVLGADTPAAAQKKVAKKSAVKRKGKAPARPSRQVTPTAERYKQIQQALATKGYLKSEPNGVWDSASIEALRRFQTDQKLDPSGKINAASLIALGLGPKTSTATTVTAPEPAPAPAKP